MTQEMFLEFDEIKLEVLRERAYELDLTIEAYLYLMIEDMVCLNPKGKETEPEKLMKQYIEKKWENRCPELAIERFEEQYGYLISNAIDDFKCENENGTLEECEQYIVDHWSEYIYEEMEFNCDHYIKRMVKLLYDDIN